MARPPDPFEKVRVMMLGKDARRDRIYPTLRPPNSTNTPESTSAPQWSPSGPTEEPTASYQYTQTIEPTPSLRSNYRSTPFRQRDYVNANSTVQGQFGGEHTRIRADKWRELSDRYRDDPKGYHRALKKLRYRDNKDKRIQAENQAAAAAAVTSETTQTQTAWAAEKTK